MQDELKQRLVSNIRARRRLIIYIACGVTALVADYGVFLLVHYTLGYSVALATPAGMVVGLVTSFVLNRLFTFSDQVSRGAWRAGLQASLYILLFVLNNIITIYAIQLMESAGIVAAIGKLAMAILVTLWTYVLYKKIIFK